MGLVVRLGGGAGVLTQRFAIDPPWFCAMLGRMAQVNCPSCGAEVGGGLGTVRMIACPYCGTTSYLKGAAVRATGAVGEMHAAPELLTLGQGVRIGDQRWLPLGHARFSYGRGAWDEYWCETSEGEGAWISVDDGDVVVQAPIATGPAPRLVGTPMLGRLISFAGEEFRVSELDAARCIALRGVFGEELVLGESYSFVNASGPDGQLLSGERGPEGWDWYLGAWVDPFEVVAA